MTFSRDPGYPPGTPAAYRTDGEIPCGTCGAGVEVRGTWELGAFIVDEEPQSCMRCQGEGWPTPTMYVCMYCPADAPLWKWSGDDGPWDSGGHSKNELEAGFCGAKGDLRKYTVSHKTCPECDARVRKEHGL